MNSLIRNSTCAAGLLAAGLLAQAQALPGVAASSPASASAPASAVMADSRSAAAAGRSTAASAATMERVLHWHDVMIKAVGYDYVPPAPGANRAYLQQPGPTHSSRAMAIVELAVYDALNAVYRRYPSYAGVSPAPSDTSPDAAVAKAAHDALAALWTAQKAYFDKLLADDLARIPDGRAKWNGIEAGRRAAAANLALRADDDSQDTDRTVGVDYFPSNAPGTWRPDPVSMNTLALGVTWGQVPPFVVPSVRPFGVPPVPSLQSDQYTRAFYQVRQLGGNGTTTPTQRTREQGFIGIFWSYDGSPWIGTPMCMYNKIAAVIATPRTKDPLEMARLMAMINAAMADAGIAAWNDKWRYAFWRPVNGIREADPGTGPTGLGDGNPDTHSDPGWTPLGAQASNTNYPDYTPPFPAYPSGHSSFGGALFQILRRFYGTDKISFTVVSDEWNGITRDNAGWVRPRIPRSFSSLSQAELENGYSRIYLGVHWQFNLEGVHQGNAIADYVFDHPLVARGTKDTCDCR